VPLERYRIEVKRSAQKEILDLQPKIRRQVEEAIDRLLSTIETGDVPQDIKSLKGEPDAYRIDSGEYRILFAWDRQERLITIYRVRHRRSAY
jgi:mRNA interferase RelE/StbE